MTDKKVFPEKVTSPGAKPGEFPEKVTVTAYTSSGEKGSELTLPESVFGEPERQAVMHQALLRQLNNWRQGTAATKTRGLVSGGGKKPYRQKGTGNARHGSRREPSMKGGGTVFGPQPRSFAQKMPRRMRRQALRSALSIKAKEGQLRVIESFDFEEPKTKKMAELLRGVGVEQNAIVVLATPNFNISKSIENLPWAKVVLARNLNLHDLFSHRDVVVTKDCLELLEQSLQDPVRPEPGETE